MLNDQAERLNSTRPIDTAQAAEILGISPSHLAVLSFNGNKWARAVEALLGIDREELYRLMYADEWEQRWADAISAGLDVPPFEGDMMFPPNRIVQPPAGANRLTHRPRQGWEEGFVYRFGRTYPLRSPRLDEDLNPRRVLSPGRPPGPNSADTDAAKRRRNKMTELVRYYVEARHAGQNDLEARRTAEGRFNTNRRVRDRAAYQYVYKAIKEARRMPDVFPDLTGL